MVYDNSELTSTLFILSSQMSSAAYFQFAGWTNRSFVRVRPQQRPLHILDPAPLNGMRPTPDVGHRVRPRSRATSCAAFGWRALAERVEEVQLVEHADRDQVRVCSLLERHGQRHVRELVGSFPGDADVGAVFCCCSFVWCKFVGQRPICLEVLVYLLSLPS